MKSHPVSHSLRHNSEAICIFLSLLPSYVKNCQLHGYIIVFMQVW